MVVCGGRSRPSGVRVWIECQNQQLISVRISAQKVPVFMEGLFFLFAVDLWTTMPQRPCLCCGFRCFSWPLVCSFDHSPFSHFPCSVSCVLCFRSSSYASFLTAGLMCYWTSTCGTGDWSVSVCVYTSTCCGQRDLIYDFRAPASSVGSRCRKPTLWLVLPCSKHPDAAASRASSGSSDSCFLQPRPSTATFPHRHITIRL